MWVRSIRLFSVFQLKNRNQTEPFGYIFLKTKIEPNLSITDRTDRFGSVCTKRYSEQRFGQTKNVQNATLSSVLSKTLLRVAFWTISPSSPVKFTLNWEILFLFTLKMGNTFQTTLKYRKYFSNYPKMGIKNIFYHKLVIVPINSQPSSLPLFILIFLKEL